MKFDVDLGNFGSSSGGLNFLYRRIDGDDASPLFRERDRRVSCTSSEFENAMAFHISEEPTVQSVNLAGAELNMLGWSALTFFSCCGVARPFAHLTESNA